MPYESPMKKKLEDALAKMGRFATPEVRKTMENAIAGLDHTDPKKVREKLPAEVLQFYQETAIRAHRLTPLVMHANREGCYIEAIILAHGLIQLSLRGLYVLSWQRATIPAPLISKQLAPFYKQKSKKGDVFTLIQVLEDNGLIPDIQADFLREINTKRNKAAHGVIFGEIAPDELEEFSKKAQKAALGALSRLRGWFESPVPLKKPMP